MIKSYFVKYWILICWAMPAWVRIPSKKVLFCIIKSIVLLYFVCKSILVVHFWEINISQNVELIFFLYNCGSMSILRLLLGRDILFVYFKLFSRLLLKLMLSPLNLSEKDWHSHPPPPPHLSLSVLCGVTKTICQVAFLNTSPITHTRLHWKHCKKSHHSDILRLKK